MATKTAKDKPPRPAHEAEHLNHAEVLTKLRIVVRGAQRHSAWIEKRCGVSGAQLWILQELLETPGLRVGEIAERLAIHQTTASNLLDALVKSDCVIKERDSTDQRVVKLMLSEHGRTLLGQAPKPARGLLAEALRKLDQQDLLQLNHGLQALLDVIGAVDVVDDTSGLQPLPFMMSDAGGKAQR